MDQGRSPTTQVGIISQTSHQHILPSCIRYVSASLSLFTVLLSSLGAEVEAQQVEEPRIAEPYVSVFFTRSQPTGRQYFYLEDPIPSLSIGGGTGGGFKGGVFLQPLNYAFGFELEGFAHGGKLTAPPTTIGGVTRFANQDFTKVNVMFNFLMRYRGDFIQPYVGGGVGLEGVFTDGQAQSAGGLQSGSHGLLGAAAQAIVGARMLVTPHFFVFGEYKYLVSFTQLDNCGSEEPPQQSNCKVLNDLKFESHYATIGVGFTF